MAYYVTFDIVLMLIVLIYLLMDVSLGLFQLQ